jgi:hypothetical protein
VDVVTHSPPIMLPIGNSRVGMSGYCRRFGCPNEAWLVEVEGIDLNLTFLHDKRAEAHRIQQREPIHLGLPAVGPWNGS